MLQHALNSLILKKDYEAITIGDICEAANISRSTFYAHYTGKDDLKRRGFEHLRRLLSDRQRDALGTLGNITSPSLGFSLAMFEHARDHRHHYRALVGGRGGIVSLGTIRQILSDLVHRELAETSRKAARDAIPRELAVQYIVGAFKACRGHTDFERARPRRVRPLDAIRASCCSSSHARRAHRVSADSR